MKNDFQSWHKLKASIHDTKLRVRFHEREIWWCALGANVGFEQDGKNDGFERPVLVYRKFNNEIFWALPITTKEKIGTYYFNFKHGLKNFSVILSQLRLLDCKRLIRKIRVLPKDGFSKLVSRLMVLINRRSRP